MKRFLFPLTVVFLVSVLVAILGYNNMVTQKQSQELENIDQKTTDEQITNAGQIDSNAPTIYCIGDSLTMNTQVKSYASFLQEMTGYNVVTFGGMQDTTLDIAIRIGAVPVYAYDVTIPAGTEPVEVTLYDEEHKVMDVLHHEGSNFKNVTIQGVAGTLTYDEEKKTHLFTRTQAGDAITLNDYVQVTSDFPEFKEDSIAVIFTGSYDPNVYMGIFDTINNQYQIQKTLNTEKYIVVSLTSKRTFDIVNDMNQVLKENFAEHYLDFRTYLLENGLNDAGITASAQDQQDLDNRYIPSSLLQSNQLDGNEKFNELLAKQLQQKMLELGYLE